MSSWTKAEVLSALTFLMLAVFGGSCAVFQPGSERGALLGTVYGDGHEPVSGARVSLFTEGSTQEVGTARSNQQGRFTIGKLDHGSYRLVVKHPDYVEQHAALRLTDSGQLVHITMQSVRSLEEKVADLIRQGKAAKARKIVRGVTARTPVLRFLDAVAAFSTGDYSAARAAAGALQELYPEMKELTLLYRAAEQSLLEQRRDERGGSKGEVP